MFIAANCMELLSSNKACHNSYGLTFLHSCRGIHIMDWHRTVSTREDWNRRLTSCKNIGSLICYSFCCLFLIFIQFNFNIIYYILSIQASPAGADLHSHTRGSGAKYSQVCGRITAYQRGHSSAFLGLVYYSAMLEDTYVSGVSLNHCVNGVRHHVWTFAGAMSEKGLTSITCDCSRTNLMWEPSPRTLYRTAKGVTLRVAAASLTDLLGFIGP